MRNDHVARVQLLEKYDTVQKRVETGASRGNETKPPPSVILGTELLTTAFAYSSTQGGDQDADQCSEI